MRISVIGPTYPYRGGISHYNTILCQNLKKNHTVDAISFIRLYPKILFPGADQKDHESKETINIKSIELIDSINPFTWLKTVKRIQKFDPNIILLYWWTPFFTFNFRLISALSKKKTSAKIVFLCHNVAPHDARFIDRYLTKIGLKKGDYYIVHAKDEKDLLLEMYPKATVIQHVHPTYDVFKEKNVEEDLTNLNLRKKVILFFGFIRKYKGLSYLLNAMPDLIKKYPDLDLLIVGEFWEEKEETPVLINKLGINDHVKIIDSYVPNEKVGNYFKVSDICVLPYLTATNSGIVQTSFGFEKPVIVTSVGGLPEVVTDGKTGFVIEQTNSEAIVKAVTRFYDEKLATKFQENIRKEKNRFSWDKLVEVFEKINDGSINSKNES